MAVQAPPATPTEVDPAERDAIRAALLDWYRRHRRELPWREVDDPYAVWVSEIMLQQTQVATVLDYYERWMVRFPSVEALARAEREAVLEMWAGLGYYRRARFLHESAKTVVEQMDGRLPRTAAGLKKLKGVGPYTAGAIASIAFGEAEAVVDGNVERVLARVYAIGGDPKATANQKMFWALAEQLVDPGAPGDFNQALMELGATVCTPQNPACLLCPLREHCRGFAQGDPSAYPATRKRTRQRPVSVRTAVVTRPGDAGREFLVVKRPADGLLGGLWEFPSVEVDAKDAPAGAMAALLRGDLAHPSAAAAAPEPLGELVHHFSHIRMTIRAHTRHLDGEAAVAELVDDPEQPVQWVVGAELESLAMSAAMRKVYELYRQAEPSG